MTAAPPATVDVCILGGGLAGLTLAHQLSDQCAGIRIAVVEHRRFPVPQATHKVGESTVEIAAHYLAEQLGLRNHLESCHLPKFGLRLFFAGAAAPTDLAGFDEVGASRVLPVPTYQIDRGILENHLAAGAVDRGIHLLDGHTLREVRIATGRHTVICGPKQDPVTLHSRFVVDTTGRRAWLRHQQNLDRACAHRNAASWFRVAGDIDIEAWSRDPAWLARCHGSPRRLSTNHFMGPGYWVWVIPLASGATSIGIVYDPDLVAPADLASHCAASRWLAREQPLLAAGLDGARLLDFHTMRDYAASTRATYSSDGWMLSGDAGMFADPFYSPGGDFIAIGNTFVSEIIRRALRDGGTGLAACYQRNLLSYFANTLSLYRGQYPGFGHRDLMIVKTAWDYAYYWAVLAKLFFSGHMLDERFLQEVNPHLLRAAALNASMQRGFRELARQRRRQGGAGGFTDHHAVPWFHDLKNDLLFGAPESAGTALATGISRLGLLAAGLKELLARVEADAPLPGLDQVAGLR